MGRAAHAAVSHPLAAAFLATRYRVQLDGAWLETRVGARAPALAAWLARHGADAASLVSARQPGGRLLPEAQNQRRERQLRRCIAALDLATWPAEGVADDGGWREPSLWVPGLQGAACRRLMQQFAQLAWVEYDASGLAQLRWTRDPH
jgi:hypothetical protein